MLLLRLTRLRQLGAHMSFLVGVQQRAHALLVGRGLGRQVRAAADQLPLHGKRGGEVALLPEVQKKTFEFQNREALFGILLR